MLFQPPAVKLKKEYWEAGETAGSGSCSAYH